MKKFLIENSGIIFIVTENSFASILLFKLLNIQNLTIEYLFLMTLNIICVTSLVSFIQNK